MDIESHEYFQKLKSFSFVEEIYLYGSRSRGDHSDRADVDLAVYCPNATEEEWNKVIDSIENADTLLEIDCVRLDKVQDNRFKNAILRDALTLYKRDRSNE